MLTVVRADGQYGTQYPDGLTAEKQAEIRSFHESQGEQVLDLPPLEKEVDNSTVPPTVTITTPPPSQGDIDAAHVSDLHRHARTLARAKRRAVMGSDDPGVPDDVMQSEFLSLLGRVQAKSRREYQSRGQPGETTELDQLEALADGLGAIDTALDAVRVKIDDGTYATEAQIDGAGEWPAE